MVFESILQSNRGLSDETKIKTMKQPCIFGKESAFFEGKHEHDIKLREKMFIGIPDRPIIQTKSPFFVDK